MRAAASAMFGARWNGRAVSDERLIARVRAGDTRAFEGIYDRYARSIHSFCRHMLGQPDDADDAVQHTFLAAYQAMRHSGQPIDLKPWLFTIARNRCLSLLRARQHEPAVAGEGAPPEPATEGLLAAVERRESLRDLLRDIGTLPDDQRSALILTQLGTLRHEEVGRVLGVPTEKVRALVFQARNSLISTRHARETDCEDIREQLATLTGGGLRRGNLRRHLVSCSGCRDYQLALKRQRAAIVLLLPVVAGPALRKKVLGEIAGGAAGAGAAGAGASGALGGLAANGVALKVGIAATVAATGVGVATLTGNVRRAFGESDSPAPAQGVAHHAARRVAAMQQVSSSLPAPRKSGSSHPSPSTHAPRRPTHSHPKRVSHQVASSPLRAADQPVAQQPGGSGSAPSGTTTQKPTPPGQTKQQGGTPPGQTKKNGAHVPPGQAKKNGTTSVPPGQAKKNGTNVPPGQVKKNPPAATPTPSAGSPPAGGSPANGSGNGNGSANGGGNGNSGGNGNAANGNGNGSGNGNGNGGGKGKGH
jgi:RNA polymerase sigma factor (sigma-70 family)